MRTISTSKSLLFYYEVLNTIWDAGGSLRAEGLIGLALTGEFFSMGCKTMILVKTYGNFKGKSENKFLQDS